MKFKHLSDFVAFTSFTNTNLLHQIKPLEHVTDICFMCPVRFSKNINNYSWILLVSTVLVVKKKPKQHEDQRVVSGRKASHFHSEKIGKINQKHCTNIGESQYSNWECHKK